MKRLSNLLSVLLCLMLLLSVSADAKEYNFSGSIVQTLAIPDDFSACTEDICDEELEALLKANKFTPDQWRKEVMNPSGYELYAMNISKNKYIYLASNEIALPKEKTDGKGFLTHRLMEDYKLIDEEKDRKKALDNLKTALTKQGINVSNIELLQWVETGDEYAVDYIEYLCYSGQEYFHCYETVYDATKIELQFTSSSKFTEAEKNEHLEILNKLKYRENVDYTEVKDVISKNLQKKLEDETHSGENTKILRIALSASIVLVIAFAVLLAIRSQRVRRKKYVKVNKSEQDKN